jgi:hypothetical protein
LEGTQNELFVLLVQIESYPIDLIVLDPVEFFEKYCRDVGQVANQVRFALNNGAHGFERSLPEGIKSHAIRFRSPDWPEGLVCSRV